VGVEEVSARASIVRYSNKSVFASVPKTSSSDRVSSMVITESTP